MRSVLIVCLLVVGAKGGYEVDLREARPEHVLRPIERIVE